MTRLVRILPPGTPIPEPWRGTHEDAFWTSELERVLPHVDDDFFAYRYNQEFLYRGVSTQDEARLLLLAASHGELLEAVKRLPKRDDERIEQPTPWGAVGYFDPDKELRGSVHAARSGAIPIEAHFYVTQVKSSYAYTVCPPIAVIALRVPGSAICGKIGMGTSESLLFNLVDRSTDHYFTVVDANRVQEVRIVPMDLFLSISEQVRLLRYKFVRSAGWKGHRDEFHDFASTVKSDVLRLRVPPGDPGRPFYEVPLQTPFGPLSQDDWVLLKDGRPARLKELLYGGDLFEVHRKIGPAPLSVRWYSDLYRINSEFIVRKLNPGEKVLPPESKRIWAENREWYRDLLTRQVEIDRRKADQERWHTEEILQEMDLLRKALMRLDEATAPWGRA